MKQLFFSVKWHFFWWFNYFVLTILLRRKISYNEREFELEKWGSPYGGWYIPTKLLNKNWIYYLVGVRDDISFDLALTERVGCHVHSFDPTPYSMKYMRRFKKNKKIHFHPIGIWKENKTMRFSKLHDKKWNSGSIIDLEGTGKKAFSAKCRRLIDVMKDLKHKRVDLLKLDIEGAEYEVLDDMFSSGIEPRVLLVEFDQPRLVLKTYLMILKILSRDYSLAIRDMWNFTFIKTKL